MRSLTLGVELEFQIVNAKTLELDNVADRLLETLESVAPDRFKREFFQNTLELTSTPHVSLHDLKLELRSAIDALRSIGRRTGHLFCGGGTHPFSLWDQQVVSCTARYDRLVATYGERLLKTVAFGLHIHVGGFQPPESVSVCNALRKYLPLLLAVAANSPLYEGSFAGVCSQRTRLNDLMDHTGIPPDISEADMGGPTARPSSDVWWDLRFNQKYATIEVRVFDMPLCLTSVIDLVALVRCLCELSVAEVEPNGPVLAASAGQIRHNRERAVIGGNKASFLHESPSGAMMLSCENSVALVVDRLRGLASVESAIVPSVESIMQVSQSDRILKTFGQMRDPRIVVELLEFVD